MARGDRGINKLDEACREHDIAYAEHKNSSERYKADKKLKSEAVKRIFARDSSLGERAAAATVSAAMQVKTNLTKMGSGISTRKTRKVRRTCNKRNKTISFVKLVNGTKIGMRKAKPQTVQYAVKAALKTAKTLKKGRKVNIPRLIKVPSTISGGILPIIPILAGLASVGALINSTAGVVKTIKEIRNNERAIAENPNRNWNVERKVGKGLYLAPYAGKNGKGLYLKPYNYSKN